MRRGQKTARILAAVQRGFETSADIAMATRINRQYVSTRLYLLSLQDKIECVGLIPSKRLPSDIHPAAKRWRIKAVANESVAADS
jgi:hypothetical protein